MLSQLRQFWDTFQIELANKNFYKASIDGMSLGLSELQESDLEAWKIRAKSLDRYKKVNRVLHHQRLLFVFEII